jgi:hypothetical protein
MRESRARGLIWVKGSRPTGFVGEWILVFRLVRSKSMWFGIGGIKCYRVLGRRKERSMT